MVEDNQIEAKVHHSQFVRVKLKYLTEKMDMYP